MEYYRAFLKHAVLEGTYVINNPFWWTADDKFFNYSVAQRLGVAVPKTVVLPQKGYPSDVDLTAESLHNLGYPIEWDALLDYVGGPAILKPYSGGGWKHDYKEKHRHELTRKLRRFEREVPDGRIAWETTPAGFERRLDEFLALHRASRQGKAKFMDARMERFFRRAITALAAEGVARVAFLDTAAGAVASFVTLEWDSTVGLYNSGFAPAQSALSPGLVLLAGVVRDAVERGRRRFDFLRGEERYKYEFGPTPEPVHRVTIEARQ